MNSLMVCPHYFPPSGKALLDVLVLGSAEQSPPIKDLMPVLGALKHMSCWHAAKITVLTQHTTGWGDEKYTCFTFHELHKLNDEYTKRKTFLKSLYET